VATSNQPGWILAAAKRDQRATIWLALLLLVPSLGFLGWNAEVLYNAWSGPFDFTEDVALSPGRRHWVSSAGPLLPTGLEQQTTLKLLKGAVSTTNVTAKYLAQPKLGKILIVKLRQDSAGDSVVGELVPLPSAVLAELSGIGPKDRFHPYLLDATSTYFTIWSLYGLLILFAGLVGVLALGLLGHGLTHQGPEGHDELVALARLGSPSALAARIESDLARAGAAGIAGPFRHSPSWLVVTDPLLRILRSEDLVALAPSAEVEGKQRTTSFAINLFRKGQDLPIKIGVETTQFKDILASLRSRFPWAYQEDMAALLRRWGSERATCEKEAATRRTETL
jgi:hypothetical protein